MGCCSSAGADEPEGPPAPVFDQAQQVSTGIARAAQERLRKLRELDAATKVPFLLIELTGEGHEKGEIEVCGKDEYGVYDALDAWFAAEWGCVKLDPGDETEETKIPFCSAQYEWPGFHVSGDDGLNNMGLMIMRLIDFMCGKLSWTLAVINSGNVGQIGEVREAQVVFKAPHPMNLVAPHMMVELRSAGFVEVCADLEEQHQDVLEYLDGFFQERFKAELIEGEEGFCDRYYRAGEGVFRGTGGSADSNFGLLATQVCDAVVQLPGWSLVSTTSGNYGEHGEYCEQQLVFRRDENPLGDAPYLMCVLNSKGEVEVNGRERREVHSKLDRFFRNQWGCERAGQFREGDIMCRRYKWPALDLMTASVQLVQFFEMQGWETQVCTQQMIREEGQQCREQQLLFRPGKTEVGTIEPHIFLELYAGEGDPELYEDEEATQVLANQYIRICRIGPPGHKRLDGDIQQLEDFIVSYLGGAPSNEEHKFNLNIFLCRGRFENNLAQWTMRLCDFMVDRLGWSFIVCSLCNMGECGQHRAQQLLFRFDNDKRDVPVSKILVNNNAEQEWLETPTPTHWRDPLVQSGAEVQKVLACDEEERDALQQMLDATFKRVLTRDRHPDDDAPEEEEMPYRLELVNAFRSEHRGLFHRFQKSSLALWDGEEEDFKVKTSEPDTCLIQRLNPGEAYLYHGTNPSSAMSILKTGFVLDHAGSATGTMFGAGVYLAECASKSDEYGRDDGGNTYPSLNALLVCRCLVGKPYVVTKAGDHIETARESGNHCVCGDRETAAKTYREFIFFDEALVYPEYTIIYRRQYAKEKVPEEMRTPTSGTTGRFWQIKVSGGWKNVPPEVNRWLLDAMKDGTPSVRINLNGTEYLFDIEQKVGINQRTGNSVPLRAPMHPP